MIRWYGWLDPNRRPHSVEMTQAEALKMVRWIAYEAKPGDPLPATDVMLRALAMVALDRGPR